MRSITVTAQPHDQAEPESEAYPDYWVSVPGQAGATREGATPQVSENVPATTEQVGSWDGHGNQLAAGQTADARRAALEAEIRVEHRTLQKARDRYRQATPLMVGEDKMPFRRAFGVHGSGGDPRGNVEFSLADGAWAEASQQYAIVTGLLQTYSNEYGESALKQFVARDGLDMTPLRPRHMLREERRRFIDEAFRINSELMARALAGAAASAPGAGR